MGRWIVRFCWWWSSVYDVIQTVSAFGYDDDDDDNYNDSSYGNNADGLVSVVMTVKIVMISVVMTSVLTAVKMSDNRLVMTGKTVAAEVRCFV